MEVGIEFDVAGCCMVNKKVVGCRHFKLQTSYAHLISCEGEGAPTEVTIYCQLMTLWKKCIL